MITLRFGIQVDMRGNGSFDPPLDSYLGNATSVRASSSSRLSLRTDRGTVVTVFGKFDLSSEEALLDSTFTGLEIRETSGALVLGVTGLAPISFNDVEQRPDALERATQRSAAGGFSITTSTFDDVLVGLAGADRLVAGGGDDVLRGGAGNDRLDAGAGDDFLDGGRGLDRLIGGKGDDAFIVDARGDVTLEASRGGIDTVRASLDWTLAAQIEKLVLSGAAALAGTGNALANTLRGNAGANVLSGLGGHDVLDGAAGGDRLIGGTGNDTYVVDSSADRVVERAGEGTDTVRTARSYTLPSQVENLSLLGGAALSGAGNNLDNSLRGNSGSNRLSGNGGTDRLLGAAGNDILAGGAGQDMLTGGADADRFVFAHTGANADDITDFLSGADSLWLDPTVFSALTAGNLDATQFRDSSILADGNDFLVYDQASGVLSYDANGDGITLVEIVDLGTSTVLSVTDIHIAIPV
ncbi:MAG: calcium-binding protein [Gammaproteobacteria bacterium]